MVDNLSFDSIDEAEASWLEREFEKREVWEVVKAINVDKGGYFMAFFQACWVVLKEDIMKVFHEFHAIGKFEISLNATFLAPIPNIPKAVNPRIFTRLV
jgi:hypothetical protein